VHEQLEPRLLLNRLIPVHLAPFWAGPFKQRLDIRQYFANWLKWSGSCQGCSGRKKRSITVQHPRSRSNAQAAWTAFWARPACRL